MALFRHYFGKRVDFRRVCVKSNKTAIKDGVTNTYKEALLYWNLKVLKYLYFKCPKSTILKKSVYLDIKAVSIRWWWTCRFIVIYTRVNISNASVNIPDARVTRANARVHFDTCITHHIDQQVWQVVLLNATLYVPYGCVNFWTSHISIYV